MHIVGPDADTVKQSDILAFQRLRKAEFVANKGWDLCSYRDYEFDQYDGPGARYLIAFDRGDCIGGARLLPCDADFVGTDGKRYSYMLRDFCEGPMSGLFPTDALNGALPVTPDFWEMTRFIAPDTTITAAILGTANKYLSKMGAREVLTISPVAMPRVLRRLGYVCDVRSRPIRYGDRSYCALSTQVGCVGVDQRLRA